MYDLQKSIFERLHNGARNSPASPVSTELRNDPEAIAAFNADRENYADYRNYFGERIDGKSHDEAVEECQKQRERRGEPRL